MVMLKAVKRGAILSFLLYAERMEIRSGCERCIERLMTKKDYFYRILSG